MPQGRLGPSVDKSVEGALLKRQQLGGMLCSYDYFESSLAASVNIDEKETHKFQHWPRNTI